MLSLCSACCLSVLWNHRVWITNMVTPFINWEFYEMKLNNRPYPNYYNDNAERIHIIKTEELYWFAQVQLWERHIPVRSAAVMITYRCCMSRLGSNNHFITWPIQKKWMKSFNTWLSNDSPLVHYLLVLGRLGRWWIDDKVWWSIQEWGVNDKAWRVV